jgi:predicted dehydrogenase
MSARTRCVIVALCLSAMQSNLKAAEPAVHLVTLDPGHFHAGLVQKFMYPQVSPVVNVYAPAGSDLQEHLARIDGFNKRAENPTHWEEKVYTGPDFLERMVRDKAGNVVVLAGNNAHKTEYIDQSIKAGFNVLADKPMAITPEGFELLRKDFELAAKKKVLVYDIMTERFEIVSIIERELTRMPEVFGTQEKGTLSDPAVVMESVHHFYKEVAGKPLIRPAWFYDSRQQGESVPDVGTHLVDLVQWECFPDQSLNWKKDIKVHDARHWPTKLTLEQFKRSTGQDNYPDFLKKDVGSDGKLNVIANGEVNYAIRGVHARVSALWNYEAPVGAKDTHHSVLRGSKAKLMIKQGPEEKYSPMLYVENTSKSSPAEFEKRLRDGVSKLCGQWPGLEVKSAGSRWQIVIPEKYSVGHETHFSQVTEHFLKYLADGNMPGWEVPNMLAKYYTTTEAYRLSQAK